MKLLFTLIITVSILLPNCHGSLGSWKDKIQNELADHAAKAVTTAKGKLEAEFGKLGKDIEQCGKDSKNELTNFVDNAKKDAILFWDDVKDAFEGCWEAVKPHVTNLLSSIKDGELSDAGKDFVEIFKTLRNDDKCMSLDDYKKTLAVELGTSEAAVAGLAQAIGITFDFAKHEIRFYVAACAKVGLLDIGLNAGITAYLFDDFKDVSGCSKYYSLGIKSASGVIAFNVPTTKRIAIGFGIELPIGMSPKITQKITDKIPIGIEHGYCFTIDPLFIGKW